MTTIDAGTNPALANQMVAGALDDKPSAPAVPAPKIMPPPEKSVTLLAGVMNELTGETATEAVIRELTGADEEALTSPSLARSIPKYLAAMALRGTETIGGVEATKDHIDGLLIGDRELLLIGIRKATYGDELELRTRCPHCDEVDEDFLYDLDTLEIKPLSSVEEAIYGFTVDLPDGRVARVAIPRAGDQDAILNAGNDKSAGELNTLMLSRCLRQIDGEPVHGAGVVRKMSIRNRNALLKAINDRSPGPQIGEAKRTCGACEQEFDLNLGLLDLFRA